ncbi:hypothetical protein FACS189426_02580 [Bacteroidia bacterium]|nr:hypothetical protein FACS189426_02580 [Bacteroidia bacterium]
MDEKDKDRKDEWPDDDQVIYIPDEEYYSFMQSLRKLEGSFTYFLPKKQGVSGLAETSVSMWDLSVNAHYLFSVADKISVYPLADLGILGFISKGGFLRFYQPVLSIIHWEMVSEYQQPQSGFNETPVSEYFFTIFSCPSTISETVSICPFS